jgi:hypothetical protein
MKTIKELEEELCAAIGGMNTGDIEAAAADLEKARIYENLMPLFVHLYNAGYMAGHNDTVESCFTHVTPSEIETYQSGVVSDLLDDLIDYSLLDRLPRKLAQ